MRKKYIFNNKFLTVIFTQNLEGLRTIYGKFRHLGKENLCLAKFESSRSVFTFEEGLKELLEYIEKIEDIQHPEYYQMVKLASEAQMTVLNEELQGEAFYNSLSFEEFLLFIVNLSL